MHPSQTCQLGNQRILYKHAQITFLRIKFCVCVRVWTEQCFVLIFMHCIVDGMDVKPPVGSVYSLAVSVNRNLYRKRRTIDYASAKLLPWKKIILLFLCVPRCCTSTLRVWVWVDFVWILNNSKQRQKKNWRVNVRVENHDESLILKMRLRWHVWNEHNTQNTREREREKEYIHSNIDENEAKSWINANWKINGASIHWCAFDDLVQ